MNRGAPTVTRRLGFAAAIAAGLGAFMLSTKQNFVDILAGPPDAASRASNRRRGGLGGIGGHGRTKPRKSAAQVKRESSKRRNVVRHRARINAPRGRA